MKVLFAMILCMVASAQTVKAQEQEYPKAEWMQADAILMHTPGQELFYGVIHPKAGLFEQYFDVDEAAKEHQYYIQGEDSYLEGGDYIPFGTIGLIGCGLRTTQGAIDEMLENDVVGHDTLVVVHDAWKDQYQMHLDTYFNVIDKDLCTLCFNRYDATSEDTKNFLTISMYAREPGTTAYHQVDAYEGQSFIDFMKNRGVKFIRVAKEDADRYGNNFLTIKGRHIACVDGQSDAYFQAMQENGVTVERIPLDQLTKGYGAAHCMTQVIKRATFQTLTSIQAPKQETVTAKGATYNLAGQQIEKANNGIYIVDGKKVTMP